MRTTLRESGIIPAWAMSQQADLKIEFHAACAGVSFGSFRYQMKLQSAIEQRQTIRM
jgi:hypothetical protein